MVWVGNSESETQLKPLSNQNSTGEGVWVPGDSFVGGREFVVNFDSIVRNVKDLNFLAGEGKLQVTTTTDKSAKLKVHTTLTLRSVNAIMQYHISPFVSQ